MPRTPRRHPKLIITVLVGALATAACSSGKDDAGRASSNSSTTTEQPPVSATPPTSADPADVPPEPAWVVQVGTPQDDALLGVTARQDELVAAGYTDGVVQAGAPTDEQSSTTAPAPSQSGRDAMVAVVGTDAEVRHLTQSGGSAAETATGVGSGLDTTIACGWAEGEVVPGGGVDDAWCAPVDLEGALGALEVRGGAEQDRLDGASVEPEGALGYAAGSTLGLFPEASDTSTGVLGSGDALLWQVDPNGSPAWIRQFGSSAEDRAEAVVATPELDAVVVGTTAGDLNGPSHGGQDGFITRYEQSGLPRWARQFGTDATDRPRGVAAAGEATRGTDAYVAVGSTEGALAPAVGGAGIDLQDAPRLDGQEPVPSNAGGTDAMVVAFDSAGEQLWTAQLGTAGEDSAAAVAVDGSTVLVTGTTAGAIDTAERPAAGGTDGFLAALDLETGQVRWITQFGSEADEDVRAITVTEDGLAVVAGVTGGSMGETPNAGGTDGFLIAFPLPRSGGSVASSL
jgi:hypothetical protein